MGDGSEYILTSVSPQVNSLSDQKLGYEEMALFHSSGPRAACDFWTLWSQQISDCMIFSCFVRFFPLTKVFSDIFNKTNASVGKWEVQRGSMMQYVFLNTDQIPRCITLRLQGIPNPFSSCKDPRG